MRIDGEPWKQPLPVDDDTVVVEISHHGQVNMLATHNCKSKSVYDPSSPHHDDGDEEDSDEEGSKAEEFRKFGAANTFKFPDEVDICHLSQVPHYIKTFFSVMQFTFNPFQIFAVAFINVTNNLFDSRSLNGRKDDNCIEIQ